MNRCLSRINRDDKKSSLLNFCGNISFHFLYCHALVIYLFISHTHIQHVETEVTKDELQLAKILWVNYDFY
jgi:hypothetical protein